MSSDEKYSPSIEDRLLLNKSLAKPPAQSLSNVESDDYSCLGNLTTMPGHSELRAKRKIKGANSGASLEKNEPEPTRLASRKNEEFGSKENPALDARKIISATPIASEQSVNTELLGEINASHKPTSPFIGTQPASDQMDKMGRNSSTQSTGADEVGVELHTGSHSSALAATEHFPLIPTNILPGSDDLYSLCEGGELLDGIIDYSLSKIYNGLSSEVKEYIHIFPTTFWDQMWARKSFKTGTRQGKPNPARVARFTQGVDIFKKRFVLVPIEDKRHWLLMIIYLAANDPNPEARGREPCILQLDSSTADGMSDRTELTKHLKAYLNAERDARGADCDVQKMKTHYPFMPQQDNWTDCGVFLLEFVRLFFQQTFIDWAMPESVISHQIAPINVALTRVKIYDSIMQAKIAEDPTFLDELGYIDLPVLALPDPFASAPHMEYPSENENRRQTRSHKKK